MKKWTVVFLALVFVLTVWNGGRFTGPKDTVAATNEAREELGYEQVELGKPVEYDSLVFTFTDVKIADHVFLTYGKEEKDNTVNVFRPVKAADGNKLVILSGTVKNNGNKELFFRGNVFINVIIDGDVQYSGNITVIKTTANSASTLFSLEPLNETEMYITAEVPASVADGLKTCDFIIGFHKDGLDTNRVGTSAQDAVFTYKLSASADENAAIRIAADTFEPEIYHLGDTLSSDTVELSFTKIVKMTKMKVKYKGKTYLYAGDASKGTHNLCLVGTLMQKAKYPLGWIRFKGDVIIDGYTYETKTWVLGQSGNKLQPMTKVQVYLFANIPDTLLNDFKECVFRFAYNEEFTSLWYEYEECDHAYTLTFGPDAISKAKAKKK